MRVGRRAWRECGRAAAVAAALASAAGCMALPVSPSGPMPAFGECGLAPNYTDSGLADQLPPQLLRWREFPVRVYADLDSIPDALRPVYLEAITLGAESWHAATGGTLGAVRWVSAAGQAQVVVRIRLKEQWRAGATAVEARGRELVSATTDVERPPSDAESIGAGAAVQVRLAVSQVVSHEMGHALGLMLHSPNPGDLMAASIRTGAGGQAITTADRHTMLQAYCG